MVIGEKLLEKIQRNPLLRFLSMIHYFYFSKWCKTYLLSSLGLACGRPSVAAPLGPIRPYTLISKLCVAEILLQRDGARLPYIPPAPPFTP